jgi:hypothetical protein
MAVSDGFLGCRECNVVGESAHFARSSPEAVARLIDRLTLCIGRSKRDVLERNPRAVESSMAEKDRDGLSAPVK